MREAQRADCIAELQAENEQLRQRGMAETVRRRANAAKNKRLLELISDWRAYIVAFEFAATPLAAGWREQFADIAGEMFAELGE